jgi:hypothetical protein
VASISGTDLHDLINFVSLSSVKQKKNSGSLLHKKNFDK